MSLLALTNYIEFPNLGWKFPLNDTLAQFHLFGHQFVIKWYGVLIAVGFLLAVIYALHRSKEFDIDPDHMIDVALITTLFAFIGARLYYVLFSEDVADYFANPISILQVWKGGLGIYGGIIVAFIVGPLLCKWRKVNIPAMCDLASLGFLIGQCIGRWGNFFNQEAFGGNTNLPWAMTGNIIASGLNGSGYDPALPVHPTFLYESLWCLLGFILLHIMSKKLYRFKGQIFCSYLVWYGAGRFAIESLRTDSLMIGTMRTSQLVAVLAILGGIILFVFLRRKALSLPMTLEETGGTLGLDEEESPAAEEAVSDQEKDHFTIEEVTTPAEDSTAVPAETSAPAQEETHGKDH